MDEQKKMFTNKSVTLFLVIVISVSAIFETIVIALRAINVDPVSRTLNKKVLKID